ncbi:hypothetical protein K7W42_19245 [Deinococcus sp. HMF7604]|uniref:hypothetical protein n=1 Tax=Deinococcus betulae TaxID=2873312 RepID=UPI001CCFC898|nr:hypothetical protein [Deinococcus betulae]MBZ9752977.1 hypothetical protein [Deinococcus betulae]
MVFVGLAVWALLGGTELGERSGFLQALLAAVLLYATWAAIDRSDRQIEIALHQQKISEKQIEMLNRQDEHHFLGINVTQWNMATLFNLSRMPIFVRSIQVGIEGGTPISYENLDTQHKIIQAGQGARFAMTLLNNPDLKVRIKEYIDNQMSGSRHYSFSDPLAEFRILIEYQYGGTGPTIYRKEYKIAGSFDHFNSEADAPYALLLVPVKFWRFKTPEIGMPMGEDLPLDFT